MNRKVNPKARGSKTLRQKTYKQPMGMNPPMIQTNIIWSHNFRFKASTQTTADITVADLLGVAGTVGVVTNTTVVANNFSVKIARIKIWAPSGVIAGSQTCSIEWTGLDFSPSKEVSDTTINISQPARISTKPPNRSLASFWQNSLQTNPIFRIVVPQDAVIDVQLSFIMNDGANASGPPIAVSTAVIGTTYYLALDGPNTNNLVPVAMTTTS